MTSAAQALTLEGLNPPDELTVSEWAERFRMLSDEASAEPGPWRNKRTPYLAGIMDAWTDPDVEDIVLMKSAQIGYTECLNNVVGYIIHHDPGPTLVIQPNLDMAKTYTTDRFDPMVTDTPELAARVAESKSRDKSNTTFHKVFPDGHVTVVGSNSSAGLKSRPIRYLICDEVDEYPFSNTNTGDPVEKAKKRTSTFRGRRKRIFGSTPSIKDASRIESMYNTSDQRKFFVPCPECDHFQVLEHQNLIWPDGEPELAQYCCTECGSLINETDKPDMLARGEWRATTDNGRRGVAGFWINELYSPFVSWQEYAETFLEAKKLPETLQTFVNESMGQVWNEDGSRIESEMFLERREEYEQVPTDALFMTLTVDTQADRLECYVKAWGVDAEAWGVEQFIIDGDPDIPEKLGERSPWYRLTQFRRQKWQVEDGRTLPVAITLIDSGGENTQSVYQYCKAHYRRERVYPIKGVGGSHPTVGRAGRGNRYKVPVYPLGVNALKSKLFSRLNDVKKPGPGFQHYSYAFDDEWFEQLTAERRVKRRSRGIESTDWIKRRDRNEAWDLEVYAIAAVEILSPNYVALMDRRERFLEGDKGANDEPDTPATVDAEPEDYAQAQRKKKAARKRPSRGKGFANSWRP